MKAAFFVLAVTLAVSQAATVEKRESGNGASVSYGSPAGQPSGYAPPAPSGSYGPSQGAPAAAAASAAQNYMQSPMYSTDPYAAMAAAAGAGSAAAGGQPGYSAGYQSPPTSYSYSDPAGYTMQQGFEGFMVPSFFSGSKLFAMIPWIIVAVGGGVLLALLVPLVLSIGGLIIPGFSLAKLLKKTAIVDALTKGRMMDSPKLIDLAQNVYAALEKFNELKKKAA